MTTPQERAKQLTEAHWNGYVKPMMQRHGISAELINTAEFHYLTSGQHFYLHAVEDCENNMFGMFGDYVGLEAELDRSCGEPEQDSIHYNRTITTQTKCPTCYDEKQCGGSMINGAGDCLHHRPKHNPERKPSLCWSCHVSRCDKDSIVSCEITGKCNRYVPALRERMMEAQEGNGDMANACPVCGEQMFGKPRGCGVHGFPPTAKQDAPKTDEPSPTHTDPATNCKDCGNTACKGVGRNVTCDQGCERFEPKGVQP